MSGRTASERLARLAARLRRRLPAGGAARVATPGDDQLVVDCDTVAHPLAGTAQKVPARSPGARGWQVWVRVQAPTSGPEPPVQRIRPPEDAAPRVATAPLRITPERSEQQWERVDPDGTRVTVRARHGPEAPLDALQAVLDAVAGELLGGG